MAVIYCSQLCRLKVQNLGYSMVRFWWRPSSRLQTSDFWLYPHMVEGVRDLCAFSFIRKTIPFMRTSPSWHKHLPEALHSNTITLGTEIFTYEFCKDANIETIAITQRSFKQSFCCLLFWWSYSLEKEKKRKKKLNWFFNQDSSCCSRALL